MFSRGDWRSVFHSVFQSDEVKACLSPVSFPLSVFCFVLRLAAVFCFCLTQNRWQEELQRISEERRGRRDKRCLPPARSRETQGKEGVRNEVQACQGARLQTPLLPVPLAQPALHHSSASLRRQRHESKLQVKGRDEGSGLLCPQPHIAFVPRFPQEQVAHSFLCHSHRPAGRQHRTFAIPFAFQTATRLLLINYLGTRLLLCVSVPVCELIFHVKGPTFFFFFFGLNFPSLNLVYLVQLLK